MKVELIKVQGIPVGYKLVAETPQDEITLNNIRNLQFFGMDDTALDYNGRIDNAESGNVKEVSWVQKINCSAHRSNNNLEPIEFDKE